MKSRGYEAHVQKVVGSALYAVSEVEKNNAALVFLLTEQPGEGLKFVLYGTEDGEDFHSFRHLLFLIEEDQPPCMVYVDEMWNGVGIGCRE